MADIQSRYVPQNGGRAPGGPFDPSRDFFKKKKPDAISADGFDPAAAVVSPAAVSKPAAVPLGPNATGWDSIKAGAGVIADIASAGATNPPMLPADPRMMGGTAALMNPAQAPSAQPSAAAAPGTVVNPAAPPPTIATAYPDGHAPVIATAIAPPAPVIPQATSDSGRPLGYGQKINGVNTFSDGSGGPGAPPATMLPSDMSTLAKGASLSRADAGIGGNIQSEAYGGTPTLGSADGLALTRPAAPSGGVFPTMSAQEAANVRAQTSAKYSLSRAANRAPGTPEGDAMRAIDMNAGRATRSAIGKSMGDQAAGIAGAGIKTTADDQATAAKDASESMRDASKNASAEAIARGNNAAEIEKAALTRPTGTPMDMADGTLGAIGADGVMRPVLDGSKKPVKRAQTKSDEATKRSNEIADGMAKSAATLLANSVTPGQQPTQQQIYQSRIQAAQIHGLQTATGKDGVSKMVNINGEWVPL